jgi:hypothetical protein
VWMFVVFFVFVTTALFLCNLRNGVVFFVVHQKRVLVVFCFNGALFSFLEFHSANLCFVNYFKRVLFFLFECRAYAFGSV